MYEQAHTNLSIWCRNITNNNPVLFWIAYFIEIEIRNLYIYIDAIDQTVVFLILIYFTYTFVWRP